MLASLALLGPSHLASGVAIVTESGERDGWLMAVGIDLGFVTLELAVPLRGQPWPATLACYHRRTLATSAATVLLPSPPTRKA
jgi:hypothetical protein